MSQDLKREFITLYLDEDGLGKFQDEIPEQRVRNDNGVLLSSFGYMFLDSKGLLDGADFLRFYHTVKTITVEPGRTMRRPNTPTIPEAHDNRVAVAGACAIFQGSTIQFARDQDDYGGRMGYQYGIDPTVFAWKNMLQGGDIFFGKACAGRLGYITDFVWLLLGMMVAVCRKDSTPTINAPSIHNLFYFRSYCLSKAFQAYATSMWRPFTLTWYIAKPILHFIAEKRFGGMKQSFRQYFGEEHVLTRLAMLQ